MEENKNIIKQLKASLKTKEEDICKKCREINDCTRECNRLKEKNEVLELNLKSTKLKFDDAKLNATFSEDKWKLEREALSDELNMKCKLLKKLENRVNDDEYKINMLVTTLFELKEASSKKFNELTNQVKKLQEEICSKENNSCSFKKNVHKFKQEN